MYDQALSLKRQGKVIQAREILLGILKSNIDPSQDVPGDFQKNHPEAWSTMHQLWYGVHKATAACWMLDTEDLRTSRKNAIDHFIQALELDATDHPVWQALSKAIWQLGDRESTVYILWQALSLLSAQAAYDNVPFTLDSLSHSAKRCLKAFLHSLQGAFPMESPKGLLRIIWRQYPRLLPHPNDHSPCDWAQLANQDPLNQVMMMMEKVQADVAGEDSTLRFPLPITARPSMDPLIVQPIFPSWPEIGRALGRLVESQKDDNPSDDESVNIPANTSEGSVIPLKRTGSPGEEEEPGKKRLAHADGDGRRLSKRVRGRGDLLEKELEDQEEALSDLVTEVSRYLSQMGFLGELLTDLEDLPLMRHLAAALTSQEGLAPWAQKSLYKISKEPSLPGKTEWTDPLVEWMEQSRPKSREADPLFTSATSLVPSLNTSNSGVLQCIFRFLWSLFGMGPGSRGSAWRYQWPDQLLPVVVRLIYCYIDGLLDAWTSLHQDFPIECLPEACLGVAELLVECHSAFPSLGSQGPVDWLDQLDHWMLQCARVGIPLTVRPPPIMKSPSGGKRLTRASKDPASLQRDLRLTWLRVRRILCEVRGRTSQDTEASRDMHEPESSQDPELVEMEKRSKAELSGLLDQCRSLLSLLGEEVILANCRYQYRICNQTVESLSDVLLIRDAQRGLNNILANGEAQGVIDALEGPLFNEESSQNSPPERPKAGRSPKSRMEAEGSAIMVQLVHRSVEDQVYYLGQLYQAYSKSGDTSLERRVTCALRLFSLLFKDFWQGSPRVDTMRKLVDQMKTLDDLYALIYTKRQ
ncbi:hypothetical protein BJ684DRAFT_17866, partial [Piptocephalis cylindrospora]